MLTPGCGDRLDLLRQEAARLQAQLVLKEGLEAQLQEALLELAELARLAESQGQALFVWMRRGME